MRISDLVELNKLRESASKKVLPDKPYIDGSRCRFGLTADFRLQQHGKPE